jgi:hypothetical protein
MWELPIAYLAAALMIGALLFLARQNRRQGWRRQRDAWGQALVDSALTSVKARVDPPLEHFSDLARLQHSLAVEDAATRKEDLVESR